jgi:membrane magnesium transporter 1
MTTGGVVFYLGVAMLVHSVYMAFSIREHLQTLHHGGSYVPAVNFAGLSMPVTTMMVPIALEVLIGTVIGIVGFVQCNKLQKARLSDVTRYLRYDHQLNTGVGFIHFNHRGTVVCKKDELKDDQKSMAEKKSD